MRLPTRFLTFKTYVTVLGFLICLSSHAQHFVPLNYNGYVNINGEQTPLTINLSWDGFGTLSPAEHPIDVNWHLNDNGQLIICSLDGQPPYKLEGIVEGEVYQGQFAQSACYAQVQGRNAMFQDSSPFVLMAW